MIKINNLNKSYTRGKEIIPSLDIEFADTGLTMIVGKSGCGKTTLLNIIGAMDLNYNGEVIIDDKDLHKMSYGEIVDYRNFITAFVFQKNSLFEFLTVEENLKLCMNIQNNKSNIDEALEKVGLKGFAHKKVKALSGGEKQRVAIARALIKNCKIIFADEPTSALDTKNAHRIFQLFKDISKDKLVIVVTHDVKKAEFYADRIVRLVDGAVVENRLLHQVESEARILPQRKTKKFALVPIFFHFMKRGLLINLFITLLVIAALTITNLAMEQAVVKAEYDYYGTSNQPEFNVDRALLTQIDNNINLYDVVKAGNATNPYYYTQNALKGDSDLNEADTIILNDYLKNEEIYYGAFDQNYNKLAIDGVSPRKRGSAVFNGITRYWYSIEASNYIYYLYDENNHYNLIEGSRRPQENNEILVSDVVAYHYLANVFSRQGIYNPVIDLQDIIDDKMVVFDLNGVIPSPEGDYHIGDPVEYKVCGVINTGILSYYTYVPDQGRFLYTSQLKTQDNDRTSIFMNSVKSQPFGYIVLKNHLKGTSENNFYYNSFSVNNITFSNNDVIYQSKSSAINAFKGTYDKTTNPAEMYDRLKNGINGTHRPYEISGKIDNLHLDVNNRIIYKSTSKENLESNQIIITVDLAKQLFPELSFDSLNMQASYQTISNQKIKMTINTKHGNKDMEMVITGLAQNNNDILFYVSEEMYHSIYLYKNPAIPSMTLNLKNYDLSERKALMENLYRLGYALAPVDTMPSPYLEFVDGKGETLAEVEYNGLLSLYPMATLEEKDGEYYFVNEGISFGFVDNINDPTIVYMSSSMIKRIILDDSYYTTIGNVSLYYLFSNYYSNDKSDTGNYVLEIISSMYLFLAGMALLIAVGFIYLKESREKDTLIKLSMLGVRPRHIYLIHFITYFLMAIIISVGTLIMTHVTINLINGMFSYEISSNGFVSTIYRYRLLFTNLSYQCLIYIPLVLFAIYIASAVIVTRIYRK